MSEAAPLIELLDQAFFPAQELGERFILRPYFKALRAAAPRTPLAKLWVDARNVRAAELLAAELKVEASRRIPWRNTGLKVYIKLRPTKRLPPLLTGIDRSALVRAEVNNGTQAMKHYRPIADLWVYDHALALAKGGLLYAKAPRSQRAELIGQHIAMELAELRAFIHKEWSYVVVDATLVTVTGLRITQCQLETATRNGGVAAVLREEILPTLAERCMKLIDAPFNQNQF